MTVNTLTYTTYPLSNQSYRVTDAVHSQTFTPWLVTNSNYCASTDITYTKAVTPTTAGQSTTFISITGRNVNWATVSNLDAGEFTI